MEVVIGLLALAITIFYIYFVFKVLEFVLVSVKLYKKMINRQDAMLQLLLDMRDNTKSYDANAIHTVDYSDTLSSRGKIGIDLNDAGVIIQVLGGGSASDAGIQTGDKLLKVDGKPVPLGDRELIIAMLAGKPNTELKVDLQRGTNQLSFALQRR
jgi:C-terminal processing protease CtpA/Prc